MDGAPGKVDERGVTEGAVCHLPLLQPIDGFILITIPTAKSGARCFSVVMTPDAIHM